MRHTSDSRTEQAAQALSSIIESLRSTVADLKKLSQIPCGQNPPDPRDEPVRELLERSSELASGCADVGLCANATALSVLARASLEVLILLLWLIESDQNPRQLEEERLTELKRVMAVNLRRKTAQVVNKHTGEDATEKFLASGHLDNLPKRISVEQRAREARAERLYDMFYRVLSIEMHGRGLRKADKGVDAAAIMFLQAVGAIMSGIELVGRTWINSHARPSADALYTALGLK